MQTEVVTSRLWGGELRRCHRRGNWTAKQVKCMIEESEKEPKLYSSPCVSPSKMNNGERTRMGRCCLDKEGKRQVTSCCVFKSQVSTCHAKCTNGRWPITLLKSRSLRTFPIHLPLIVTPSNLTPSTIFLPSLHTLTVQKPQNSYNACLNLSYSFYFI